MYRVVNICTVSDANIGRRHQKKRRKCPVLDDLENFKGDLLALSLGFFSKVEALVNSKSRKFLEKFATSRFLVTLPTKVVYIIRAGVDYFRKVKPKKIEKENYL